ncbi:MAG TPA: P27 family phage terminase small subunit [Solirubrobacteraceae bacterium]
MSRKRATPVSANGNGEAPHIVPPPDDLGAAGRRAWSAAWALARIEPADAMTVERLARLEDEAAQLRSCIAEQGPLLWRPIQNSRGEQLGEEAYEHPGTVQLRRIGKEIAELCMVLGLSPAARKKLGLAVEEDPREPDELDELRKRYAARRGEPDPGIDARRLR